MKLNEYKKEIKCKQNHFKKVWYISGGNEGEGIQYFYCPDCDFDWVVPIKMGWNKKEYFIKYCYNLAELI